MVTGAKIRGKETLVEQSNNSKYFNENIEGLKLGPTCKV